MRCCSPIACCGPRSHGGMSASDIFTIPVMMNSYLGALKGWVFAPLFAAFGYRVATIRIPAVLLACVTIFLVYRLLREIAGQACGIDRSVAAGNRRHLSRHRNVRLGAGRTSKSAAGSWVVLFRAVRETAERVAAFRRRHGLRAGAVGQSTLSLEFFGNGGNVCGARAAIFLQLA